MKTKEKTALYYSKDACPYKASQLKPAIYELKDIFQNEENKTPVNCFKSKHGYMFLTRSLNKKIFSLLDKSGFWLFHCSNKGQQICSLHQLRLYLHKGWQLLLRGYTCDMQCCEIHHLDHDPSNNHPSNLVYVTSQENKLLSDFCRMTYNGSIKNASINPFNYKGTSRFIGIIKKTIKATYARLGLNAPEETVFAWLMNLPAKLGKEIVYAWQYLPSKTQSFIRSVYVN